MDPDNAFRDPRARRVTSRMAKASTMPPGQAGDPEDEEELLPCRGEEFLLCLMNFFLSGRVYPKNSSA